MSFVIGLALGAAVGWYMTRYGLTVAPWLKLR